MEIEFLFTNGTGYLNKHTTFVPKAGDIILLGNKDTIDTMSIYIREI